MCSLCLREKYLIMLPLATTFLNKKSGDLQQLPTQRKLTVGEIEDVAVFPLPFSFWHRK